MSKEHAEIELNVPESGALVIPTSILKRLNLRRGSKVRVRLTTEQLSDKLMRRNVTEEEIEYIAALQLEPRKNVVKFLTTESSLSKNKKFRNRARALRS